MGGMKLKLHHLLFAFIVFTLFTSVLRNATALHRNTKFLDQLKNEYESEKLKNEKLQLKYAKSSNPFEIEKIVRNKLGLVRPGEELIIIPTPSVSPSPIQPR